MWLVRSSGHLHGEARVERALHARRGAHDPIAQHLRGAGLPPLRVHRRLRPPQLHPASAQKLSENGNLQATLGLSQEDRYKVQHTVEPFDS